jgi:hypothetical protein
MKQSKTRKHVGSHLCGNRYRMHSPEAIIAWVRYCQEIDGAGPLIPLLSSACLLDRARVSLPDNREGERLWRSISSLKADLTSLIGRVESVRSSQ